MTSQLNGVPTLLIFLFYSFSPNLVQRCKIPWLRSLLFCGVIDLNLQGQILSTITHHPTKLGPEVQNTFKFPIVLRGNWPWPSRWIELSSQNFQFHHYRKHITTRESCVLWLLHRLDCFIVFIPCMYLYTQTVSWSGLFHSLIPLHIYWSRQLKVFRSLTSLLS